MNNTKKTILIFIDWFYPGFKAGGPIQSCVNLVQALEEEFQIYIIASSKDFGETKPYDSVPRNQWVSFGISSKVLYLSEDKMKLSEISTRIKEVDPDIIYLNSMYSKVFTIFPIISILYRKISNTRILVATRGMLKPSAIEFKKKKKTIFFLFLKMFNIHKKIEFHATDKEEKAEIQNLFGKKGIQINIASNLPVYPIRKVNYILKNKNTLSLFYMSRIHPIKNLDIIIESLTNIDRNFNITFDIGGFIEDESYWEECQRKIEKLPSNIEVNFIGKVNKEDVMQEIQARHFFILPTKGENFGHAIFESLASGRPIIISNTTPWKELEEKRIGWDISLNDIGKFTAAIEKSILLEQQEFDLMCQNSLNFAHDYINETQIKEQYKKMFLK